MALKLTQYYTVKDSLGYTRCASDTIMDSHFRDASRQFKRFVNSDYSTANIMAISTDNLSIAFYYRDSKDDENLMIRFSAEDNKNAFTVKTNKRLARSQMIDFYNNENMTYKDVAALYNIQVI